MKITLYKGYHSNLALQTFNEAWVNNDLILFLPPTLMNYEFVSHLPEGEVRTLGELWEESPKIPKPEGTALDAVAGVFSSGTSQVPRLVLYSKKNIESSVCGIFELFDRDLLENIFCYPQPFHTFGLTLGYGAAKVLSLHLITPEGRYSQTHHKAWRNHVTENTLTLGTPTHFYDLLNKAEELGDLPASYSCIIGGAKVEKELWKNCQSILKIAEPSIGYGATEASPGITHLPPGAEPHEDGEIGIPLSHVDVDLTPTGLVFQGPNLCTAIIDSEGIHHPQRYELPDIIQVRDQDQHWIYKTRSNWFLNRGGEKFSLEGLESFVQQETGLETLCVGVPDQRLGEDLGILIRRQGDAASNLKNKVLQCLKEKTDREFSSQRMVLVDQLPLNENLKKDRKQAMSWIQTQLND